MKDQLVETFGVREEKITIIPFRNVRYGAAVDIDICGGEAAFGAAEPNRTILFFGRITPYKGIDLLVDAFARLAVQDQNYRLVIAGEPMKEWEQQWQQVRGRLSKADAGAGGSARTVYRRQ